MTEIPKIILLYNIWSRLQFHKYYAYTHLFSSKLLYAKYEVETLRKMHIINIAKTWMYISN